jgi:hypothetical protein
MRTMICPVSNSNVFEEVSMFFIFQFDRQTNKAIKVRSLLFDALNAAIRPTYMTWLGESWGAWVDRKVVDRYLDDLDGTLLTSEQVLGILETLDNNEAALLPGEQEDFNPETYISGDDDEIRVDCEQMIVTPTEVHFDCQFKNSSDLLSVSPMKIEDLYKAVGETA